MPTSHRVGAGQLAEALQVGHLASPHGISFQFNQSEQEKHLFQLDIWDFKSM